MAIRLRTVDGVRIALCAARSMPKEGDLYLDDGDHYTLSEKFWRDYSDTPGLPRCDERVGELVEREESNNPNRTWWDAEYAAASTPVGGQPTDNQETK